MKSVPESNLEKKLSIPSYHGRFHRRSMSRDAVARAAVIERRRPTDFFPISHHIGEKVRPSGVIIYPGSRACSAADVSDWRSMFAYDTSSAARRDGAGYSRLDWRR